MPPGPPAIQFNLPMDPAGALYPPNPCGGGFCYSFGATDGTNNFDVFFDIAGASPLDTASWVMQKPGPINLPAVQFNFNFLTAADPTLTFSVTENGQPLNFSPVAAVPEPETYAMLLAGLGLMFFARRSKYLAA